MLQGIYTVYDTKARAYLPPWISLNDDTARRAFAEAANTRGHQFQKYAADYILFRVGDFDDSTGVPAAQTHLSLGLAQTFKEPSHGNGSAESA